MRVLGIESSCDDSSISLLKDNFCIEFMHSQAHIECLAPYQGVMPEVVAREHCRFLPELIKTISHTIETVDAIAYTAGPGLAGSLLIGSHVAHTLSLYYDIPLIPIHHIEGHILATVIEHGDLWQHGPVLILIVSGGHTQLVYSPERFKYHIIGQTRDDAAGEAFDKIAKHLGLGYPGGAKLSHLAAQAQERFPKNLLSIPMMKNHNLDFSFSGLKTQATTTDYLSYGLSLEQYCATVEYTIVEALKVKTQRALEQHPLCRSLILCGGVAANTSLRKALAQLCVNKKISFFHPHISYCTDNGAMIAAAGLYHLQHQGPALKRTMFIQPRWSLNEEPEQNPSAS